MRKPSLFVLSVSLLATVVTVRVQEQTTYTDYYVFTGTTLKVPDDFSLYRTDRQWQVWLYDEGVHIPHYTAGLQYSRWGLIQGRSAESVERRLKAAQGFERAYLNFFGPGTWGRYTFFNALGPIAITDQAVEKNPAALDERFHLDELSGRVDRLIAGVQPSLENNESAESTSSIKEYFDQIRDASQQVSRLYSQLARPSPQVYFIRTKVSQTDRAVALAGNNVPKITAILPSVKLPTSTPWMSHTEAAGSDGIIRVDVTQIGPPLSLPQTFSGGNPRTSPPRVLPTLPFFHN